MLKYLRIAVTALSLTACALLVALWVRSYWYFDDPEGHIGEMRMSFLSVSGKMRLDLGWWGTSPKWEWHSKIIEENESIGINPGNNDRGINFQTSFFNVSFSKGRRFFVWMPSWLPTVLFGILAIAPWLRWHFSLRTLLIATTLVAVALAAIVAAPR
jgi:hypothetical protein